MNHKLLLALMLAPATVAAQNAFEGQTLSQLGLRGTARFMSMGGAFTALGGDLSTLNQNPAGIGVYRSNDLGATLQIDFQQANTMFPNGTQIDKQTRAACNNFGYVGTMYLGESSPMPFFNYGASYSRVASFERRYGGPLGQIGTSLTNLVADYTTSDGYTPNELLAGGSNAYDPYWDSSAPWTSILMYNSYGINPLNDASSTYRGLFDYDRSSAQGWFEVQQKGYVDEYNITFGGNVMNCVYWGLGVGITDLEFKQYTYYSESIDDARMVALNRDGHTTDGFMYGHADMDLNNYMHTYGTGVNVKIGVVVKPIDEFRIGIALHTPTWYNLTSESYASTAFRYDSPQYPAVLEGERGTNDGYDDVYDWKLRTPLRLMVGMAGVVGGRGIISADYEYRPAQAANMQDNNGNDYRDLNDDMHTYYKAVNIARLGAEYRVSPHVSLRAGYCYESSPVTQAAMDDQTYLYTSGPGDAGTQPSVTLPRSTQYVTAGLGYKYKSFYADLAYVHKYQRNRYQAFTSYDEQNPDDNGEMGFVQAPRTLVTQKDNSMVLTIGFRF